MLDLQSGGMETKQQLKGHNLNPLQLCMGFINQYHNPLTYCLKLHPLLI